MKNIKFILRGLGRGVLSFTITFFAVPKRGIADFIWIFLCVALSSLSAVLIFKSLKCPPPYTFFGFLIQAVMLVVFRNTIAKGLGINMWGIGSFAYIYLFVFPAVISVLSYIILKMT